MYASAPRRLRIHRCNLMSRPPLSRPPLRCDGSEKPAEPRELRCRRNEWGLLGADDDPAYLRRIANPDPDPERIVYARGRGADDYSNRGQIRTAHPLLRDREPCKLSNPRRIKLCR